MSNKKLEKKLYNAQIALNNAQADEYISSRLRQYNYDDERMSEGIGFFKTATRLFQLHLDAKKEQMDAADAFRSIDEEARDGLVDFRKIARIALKDHPSMMKSLGLDQSLKRNLGNWLEQARIFYTNALNNPQVMEKMAKYGIGETELNEGNGLIDRVEEASAFHKRKQAETDQAVKNRDNAFKDLNRWMKDFWVICRIALASKPEYLKKLKLRS
jgi:hypothetical protein